MVACALFAEKPYDKLKINVLDVHHRIVNDPVYFQNLPQSGKMKAVADHCDTLYNVLINKKSDVKKIVRNVKQLNESIYRLNHFKNHRPIKSKKSKYITKNYFRLYVGREKYSAHER